MNLFAGFYPLTFRGSGGVYHTVPIDTDRKHIWDCAEAYQLQFCDQALEGCVGGGPMFMYVSEIQNPVLTPRSNSKHTHHHHNNHSKGRRRHASHREEDVVVLD